MACQPIIANLYIMPFLDITMLAIPPALDRLYDTRLERQGVAAEHRPHYKKWLRFYWDFCHKYHVEPTDRQSFPAFREKLRTKNQSEAQIKQAYHAISLYYETIGSNRPAHEEPLAPSVAPPRAEDTVAVPRNTAPEPAPAKAPVTGRAHPQTAPRLIPTREETAVPARPSFPPHTPLTPPPRRQAAADDAGPAQSETPRSAQISDASSQDNPQSSAGLKVKGASWVGIYDHLDSAIKVRHYSPKTLEAYKHWTQKFQTFTKSKDPQLLSIEDVKKFLSFLAVDRKVAASSQNQAFNALLFLFKHVLEKDFGKIEGVVRAKRRPSIPVVRAIALYKILLLYQPVVIITFPVVYL